MKFKRTLLATFLIGLFSPYGAQAADLNINPWSNDVIYPNGNTVDKININPNEQTIDKSIGNKKDIEELIVNNGLTVATSGTAHLTVSVKKLTINGRSGISIFSTPPYLDTSNNKIDIDSDIVSINGSSSGIIFSAKSEVNIGSVDAYTKNINIAGETSSGVSVSGDSKFSAYGTDVLISANVSKGNNGGIYTTGRSSAVVNSDGNIIISNKNESGRGIFNLGGDKINLHADKEIKIVSNKSARAVEVSNAKNGTSEIELSGENVSISGQVIASGSDTNKNDTKLFINADDTILINSNSYGSNYSEDISSSIYLKNRATTALASNNIIISNENKKNSAYGIEIDINNNWLQGSGSELDCNFVSEFTVNAVNAIVNGAGALKIKGDANGQSKLTLNSNLSGLVSKSKDLTSIKDTSIEININKIKEVSGSPTTGGEDIVGIASLGHSSINLTNTTREGKSLAVNIQAGDNNKKVSAITATGTMPNPDYNKSISISNYDNVILTVDGSATKNALYGIRSSSGQINLSNIGNLMIDVDDGSGIYVSRMGFRLPPDGTIVYNEPGKININADQLILSATGTNGKGLNADHGTIDIKTSNGLSISASSALVTEAAASKITIEAQTVKDSLIKGDWSIKQW